MIKLETTIKIYVEFSLYNVNFYLFSGKRTFKKKRVDKCEFTRYYWHSGRKNLKRCQYFLRILFDLGVRGTQSFMYRDH